MTNYEYGLQDPATKWIRYRGFDTYDAAEEYAGKLTGDRELEVVYTQVEDWRPASKPVDHSADPDVVREMDHVIGSHIDFSLKHAFRLTEAFKEAIIEGGFGRYYGGASGSIRPVTLCSAMKRGSWSRRISVYRGDITELGNETYPGFNGTEWNTVCEPCQRAVLKMRKVQND